VAVLSDHDRRLADFDKCSFGFWSWYFPLDSGRARNRLSLVDEAVYEVRGVPPADVFDAVASAGVSVDTVRYYERSGLLAPAMHSRSGYRLYTHDQLRTLRFIRRAQALGFSLAEIAELLELLSTSGDRARVREVAARRLAEAIPARLHGSTRSLRLNCGIVLLVEAPIPGSANAPPSTNSISPRAIGCQDPAGPFHARAWRAFSTEPPRCSIWAPTSMTSSFTVASSLLPAS
jgi:MerR family transcriptional regulator, copper efflux regulator